MDELQAKPKGLIAVSRRFESSRLESELLAAAYEHAVPILSRAVRGQREVSSAAASQNAMSVFETGVEDRVAIGGLVG